MDFQDARISYLYLFYFLAKVDFLPIYCHFMLHCPLVLPLTLLLLFFFFSGPAKMQSTDIWDLRDKISNRQS